MLHLLALLACTRPPSPPVSPGELVPPDPPQATPAPAPPASVVPEPPATPMTDVLTLFQALPEEALPRFVFEGTDRQTVLSRTAEELAPGEEFEGHAQVVDLPNNFLRFYRHGDGDSETAEFSALALPTGENLLAVHAMGGPSCGNVSRVRVYRHDGAWTDITDATWPTLDWSLFGADAQGESSEPEWQFSFPGRGRDVTATLSRCTEFDDPERGERLLAHRFTFRFVGERFEIVGHARP